MLLCERDLAELSSEFSVVNALTGRNHYSITMTMQSVSKAQFQRAFAPHPCNATTFANIHGRMNFSTILYDEARLT